MLELSHKKEREGKATSSEFFKLMGIKGLNQLGNTYALDKAIEVVFGVDEEDSYESYDMTIGIEREPLAYDFLKAKIELNFDTIEPGRFVSINKDTGGTPDAIINTKIPVETKCPKSEKYFTILRYGVDALDPNWIIQIQHQMWQLKADVGIFNLFTIYNSKPYHHFYEIKANKELHSLMSERLDEWALLRDEHVKVLQSKLL